MYLCKNLSLDFTGDHCYKAEEKCKLANIMKNKEQGLSKESVKQCEVQYFPLQNTSNANQIKSKQMSSYLSPIS